MMQDTTIRRKVGIGIAVGVVLAGCTLGGYVYVQNQAAAEDGAVLSTTKAVESIDIDDSSSDIDWSALPTTSVTLTDETYTITDPGTYVLTGDSTSGVVVNSDGNVRLALNGVAIANTSGAGIYVENAENVVVQLVDGSSSTVSDSATRSDETINGAIFSSDDLQFTGNGSLTVTGNFADGIVSKDDLVITAGSITVTAVDDAIRGKDSVTISGGDVTVAANGGDGIKSTNETESDKGYVYINGGTVQITAAESQGIKAVTSVIIEGGSVDISNVYEGIEATNITISDGDVVIDAQDDGINASSNTTSESVFIEFNGGTVDVTVGSGDTDAFDSNGDIYVHGGTITVTAPTSSFDYDGSATFDGGTVVINGEEVSTLPQSMMGGGGMMRR